MSGVFRAVQQGKDQAWKLSDDEMVEAIIAECDGDARAAVLAFLKVNQCLMTGVKP